MPGFAGGRARVFNEGKAVEYESTDGVSHQTARFYAKNREGLPSLSTHWLNDGDHVVFVSREAAIEFLERCLRKLRPSAKKVNQETKQ